MLAFLQCLPASVKVEHGLDDLEGSLQIYEVGAMDLCESAAQKLREQREWI